MSSDQSGSCMHEKLMAMRDASAGAFEAARRRYFTILNEVEVLSVAYIEGKATREEVRVVSEQLQEAEGEVNEAARRTRMYQEAIDSLPTRRRPVPKVNPIPQPRKRGDRSAGDLSFRASIEFKTGLPRYDHISLLNTVPKMVGQA